MYEEKTSEKKPPTQRSGKNRQKFIDDDRWRQDEGKWGNVKRQNQVKIFSKKKKKPFRSERTGNAEDQRQKSERDMEREKEKESPTYTQDSGRRVKENI